MVNIVQLCGRYVSGIRILSSQYIRVGISQRLCKLLRILAHEYMAATNLRWLCHCVQNSRASIYSGHKSAIGMSGVSKHLQSFVWPFGILVPPCIMSAEFY